MDVTERLALAEKGIASCLSIERLLELRSDVNIPLTVASFYGEISAPSMKEVMEAMDVGKKETDVLLDFGCGSGRWMVAAHEAGVRHIVGVEYCADRADVATRVTSGIGRVVTGDGLNPGGVWTEHRPTHVVLYNVAFPPSIQQRLWDRIVAERSVSCVAVWRRFETPEFDLVATLVTVTPVDEKFKAYIYRRRA